MSIHQLPSELSRRLDMVGFSPADSATGRRTLGAVAVDPDDGRVCVREFTADVAHIMKWQVYFDLTTPVNVIVAAICAAIPSKPSKSQKGGVA